MKHLVTAFCLILVPLVSVIQTNPLAQTPTLSIRGKVLQEPNGQPIRKANVQLNGGKGPTGAQYSAVTDGDGQFTIEDVQAGRYGVVVEHPGFVQSNIGGHLTTISVQPGSGRNDLILHMQAAAIITGKIVDLDGDPMRDVSVTATRVSSIGVGRNSHNFGYAATNDLGEFRISDLRAGQYKITAAPPQGSRPPDLKEQSKKNDHSVYLPTYYPGVLEDEQAVALEIRSGAETPINFAVLTGRAYRVNGSVTGVQSKGNMAQIILQPNGSGRSDMAPQELGEGGKFEFVNVLPGSYVAILMTVTFEGDRPAMQLVRLGPSIEVSNSHVVGLQLQPEASGQVRGKFRLDTGQKFDWTQVTVTLLPVQGFGVGLVQEGVFALPTSASVNIDGTFELKNVGGGSYQVAVGAKSDNLADYVTKSVNLDSQDVADSGFKVLPQTYLDIVVSPNGASITGKVVDTNGQPIANAIVVDVPMAEHRTRPDLYQRDITDESGHFNLRGLNPGKYTVLAFEDLQEDVRQPEFLKSYRTRGETIQLDEGNRKNVVLKLIPYDAEVP
ncbi:MAG TPA: carboxypeptidase-like regulatory domain-containing protein [Candidatus Acidoferrum sp.]|nr:carboxypeptidase-like regulatory domain-containing protein [Candidatus Acidoferrum sp.]